MADDVNVIECVSAGGVLVREDRCVLLCHPTNSSSNVWLLPKGQTKEGEAFEEVAYREVLEETGYHCRIKQRVSFEVEPYKSVYIDEVTFERVPAMKSLVFFLMEPLVHIQKPDWECDYFLWVQEKDLATFASKRELPVIISALEQHYDLPLL